MEGGSTGQKGSTNQQSFLFPKSVYTYRYDNMSTIQLNFQLLNYGHKKRTPETSPDKLSNAYLRYAIWQRAFHYRQLCRFANDNENAHNKATKRFGDVEVIV